MRCLYPMLIGGQREGKPLSRVPCGQCINCRLNYARMWSIRIMHEAQQHSSSIFLTLTYRDEELPENHSIDKRDLCLFLKKFRKAIGKKVRFFACGEYGEKTKRPHYHIILFNVQSNDNVFSNHSYDYKAKGYWVDCKGWEKGQVFLGNVTLDSANYVAGYVVKKVKGKGSKEYYESLGIIPEFCVMSRKPGIGFDFMDKNSEDIKARGYFVVKGKTYPLPRFYKEKIYTDEEKALIAEESKLVNEKKLIDFIQETGYSGSEIYFRLDEIALQREKNVQAKFNLMKGKKI